MLKVVETHRPAAPYDAETSVKGWRLDLDYERIIQSGTWALCPADMRPWLLMVWFTAWQQRPAGSFENDSAIIAARIGMDVRIFEAHRDILLRGFRLHDDGRLYHGYIVGQVRQYLESKKAARERARESRERARESRERTRESQERARTYTHVRARASESQERARTYTHVRDGATPTPTPTPTPKEEKHASHARFSIDAKAQESAGERQPQQRQPRCPYNEIRNLWIEILPELGQPLPVEQWTSTRKNQVRARWKDQLPTLEHWRRTFEYVRASNFLMGRVESKGRRPFAATLWWVCKPENLLKIYEGNYDD